MRLAHVSTSMEFGGAERVLADLALAQSAAGSDVAIVAAPGGLDRDWPALGVTRRLVAPSARDPRSVVRATAGVVRALHGLAPDLVHAHNVKATAMALAARPWRRVPVVTTMHGVAREDLAGAVRILRRSDLVVAVSDSVRDELLDAGLAAERVRVIRNGIADAPAPAAAARRELTAQLRLSGSVVCAVGRFVPQKAHDRFLAAAAIVLSHRPRTTFLLVGDGPLRVELEHRATTLGIDGSVRFTGMRDDARELIALSDLLVFSSEWEGLSIAALEALAAGTPIVTTDVAGMRELLGPGAGVVVPGWEPSDLAVAILDVLDDEARRQRMGEIAREVARAEFSAEAMRDAYLRTYRDVAGARQR